MASPSPVDLPGNAAPPRAAPDPFWFLRSAEPLVRRFVLSLVLDPPPSARRRPPPGPRGPSC